MNEAFRLKGVRKDYGDFRLRISDLALERGYVMGLVGRNGAGKSTTIKILMNLVYPDGGDVRVLGLRQPRDEMEIKRRVGYVSEEPVFYGDMTVAWMARLVRGYYPTWDDGLFRAYLRKFAIDPYKKVKELSRGTKVKLALTLALSHRPELLILDEPTSGVDPVVRHEILEEIGEIIRDEGRTVLLSSHITQDIERVADYVAIIERGEVVDFSDKESILDRWKKVSGTLPVDGCGTLDELAPMFTQFRREGAAFVGVTGSFCPDWLDALRGRGASDLRVASLGLDEILVLLSDREGQA